MPKRTHWIPHFSTGNATLDEQHQQLLAQCNALADCLDNPGLTAGSSFSSILEGLFASVREHFATEKELLAGNDYPMLDAHVHEGEEFDYLASEIISAKNFDQEELQTYLALWCTGHIVGTSGQQRPYLERRAATAN